MSLRQSSAGYEQGHVRGRCLTTHPGAAANDSSAAGVSASGTWNRATRHRSDDMSRDTLPRTLLWRLIPGRLANDSSAAGVSASGDVEQGYASPQATMQSPGIAADKGSGTNALSSMSAKDLVDEPVQNAAGEKLGEIDAIVTDKTAGAHGYAVIGFGGVLGVGEKQVLVQPRSTAGRQRTARSN